MQFDEKDKRPLLIKSGRRCCLCWKYCGTKIEVAHIIPDSEGGSNDEDNGIPLCFDCHAEVDHYNLNHPRGNKFSPKELKEHRERLFQHVKHLMDLIEDPCCFKKEEQLLQKAKAIERQIQDRIPKVVPGSNYMRP